MVEGKHQFSCPRGLPVHVHPNERGGPAIAGPPLLHSPLEFASWLRYLWSLRRHKVLGHGADKRDSSRRHRNVRPSEWFRTGGACRSKCSCPRCSGSRSCHPGRYRQTALVARIAQQLRVHLPVGGGLPAAANRSGCRRCIAADLELVLQQVLKSRDRSLRPAPGQSTVRQSGNRMTRPPCG